MKNRERTWRKEDVDVGSETEKWGDGCVDLTKENGHGTEQEVGEHRREER